MRKSAAYLWITPLLIIIFSVALSLTLLVSESFGRSVSGWIEHTTGWSTVYSSKEAQELEIEQLHRLVAFMEDDLMEAQTQAHELRNKIAVLESDLRDSAHGTTRLYEQSRTALQEQRDMFKLIKKITNINDMIKRNLTRHIKSALFKSIPTIGSALVISMSVVEVHLMCNQIFEMEELMRELDYEEGIEERPLECLLSPQEVLNYIFKLNQDDEHGISWREECLALEAEGFQGLRCERFPTSGPIDPDAWIQVSVEDDVLIQPVNPDDWIRESEPLDSPEPPLTPVDPN